MYHKIKYRGGSREHKDARKIKKELEQQQQQQQWVFEMSLVPSGVLWLNHKLEMSYALSR